MIARHDQREAFDLKVFEWLRARAGQWFRVVDVAGGLSVPVVLANNALRRLHAGRQVERAERQKRHQGRYKGREYPVYRVQAWNAAGPSWMVPTVPQFTENQIVGCRMVRRLGEDDDNR